MANPKEPDSFPEIMTVEEIKKIIPHRYPFLFVDRIENFVPGKKATGFKQVSMNDYFFQGHFPQRPVMPGVLILEAMAQATGLLAFRTLDQTAERETLYFLVGMDKVRFKRPVEPGDQLVLTLWGDTEVRRTLNVGKEGTVYIKDVGIVPVFGYKFSELNEKFKSSEGRKGKLATIFEEKSFNESPQKTVFEKSFYVFGE